MEYEARIKATFQKRMEENQQNLQNYRNKVVTPCIGQHTPKKKKKKKTKKAGNHIALKRKKKNRTYSDKEVTSTKW